MQNGLNDIDWHKDVPFVVKVKTSSNTWPPDSMSHKTVADFPTLKILLDFAFNISSVTSKHP